MAYNKEKIRKNYDLYIKANARKSSKRNGFDPNDRSYDRKLEKIIKKMKPEELYELINGDFE